MKCVHVKNKSGKKVPITLLSDWGLPIYFPVFIWNLLMWFVISPVLAFCNRVLVYPVYKIAGDIMNMGKRKIAFISCLPMISLFVAYAAYNIFPDIKGLYLALIFIVSLALSLSGGDMIVFLHNQMLPLSFQKSAARTVMEKESELIPEYLVDHQRTRGLVVTGSMVTVHVLYCLVFLFLLKDAGYLYLLPVISLVQVAFLADKEFIEHIASHARKGQCVNSDKAKTRLDRIYAYLNFFRVYIAWPIQLWMPNHYFCTHTGIHHVENNGPADSQSTLRFDQTSFIGFIKSTTWFSFLTIFPYDSARYFIALKRKKFLKIFLSGYVAGVSLICFVSYFHPLLGLCLIAHQVGSGLPFSLFVHRWHGFHDSTRLYSVDASNNSPIHFGHHKQPNVHITVAGEYARIFWRSREENPKKFPVFLSSDAMDIYTRNWFLFLAMLWQNKLDIVGKFIVTESDNMAQLKKYVSGAKLQKSSSFVRKIDEILSKNIGRYIENACKKYQTKEDYDYFYSKSRNVMYDMKVMNFNKFKIKEDDTTFPSGIY